MTLVMNDVEVHCVNTDDDDEYLGNVWMSVPHPLDWNFCFGTIPRFWERETHPENTDLT